MISRLRIKNFALIVEHEIYFQNGLNVISGETGSGKSIILNAIKFVLGGRGDKSFIRNGENIMRVEACFDDIDLNIKNCLSDLGIDSDDEQLIIVRTLNIDGKGEIKINGSNANLSMLKQITTQLVDIYGQFDNHSLLQIKNHISIIDNFNKTVIDPIKDKLKTSLNELKEINKQLDVNFGSDEDKLREVDLLTFQINELEESDIKDTEEQELVNTKTKILAIEKIAINFEQIIQVLNYSYNNSSITNAIKTCNQYLKAIESFDENYKEINDRLLTVKIELEDLSNTITQASESLFYDQSELDKIEERLDLIKLIKRKYGDTEEKRISYLKSSKEKLDFIINNEKVINNLKKQKAQLLDVILNYCKELNHHRHEVCNILSEAINKELNDLGFRGAKFDVLFINEKGLFSDLINLEDNLTSNGLDNIEFVFSANSGEPLKPLNKIISGGEMSRFMLAYKNVVAQKDNINTLIFDEIDTGISGVIGQQVANKLTNISNNHQILAISHLPQIIATADHNYLVQKFIKDEKTYSTIVKLNEEELLNEICRVSGQIEKSELSILHAKELRTNAIKYKTKM